jgi:hypothetical protein
LPNAKEVQLTHVCLETDSIHIITMINQFTSIIHLQPLFHEVISLFHLLGRFIHVNHIYREANYYVDGALAFGGHNVGFPLVILDI